MKKYAFYQLLPVLVLLLSVVSCTASGQQAGQQAASEEGGVRRAYDLLIVSTPGELQLEISCTLP